MSSLRQSVRDYLAVRRSLGFQLDRAGSLLPDFVRFVERSGASRVTIADAVAWATLPAGAAPQWCAHRLGMVRCFARYLQTLDPSTEVPPEEFCGVA